MNGAAQGRHGAVQAVQRQRVVPQVADRDGLCAPTTTRPNTLPHCFLRRADTARPPGPTDGATSPRNPHRNAGAPGGEARLAGPVHRDICSNSGCSLRTAAKEGCSNGRSDRDRLCDAIHVPTKTPFADQAMYPFTQKREEFSPLAFRGSQGSATAASRDFIDRMRLFPIPGLPVSSCLRTARTDPSILATIFVRARPYGLRRTSRPLMSATSEYVCSSGVSLNDTTRWLCWFSIV